MEVAVLGADGADEIFVPMSIPISSRTWLTTASVSASSSLPERVIVISVES